MQRSQRAQSARVYRCGQGRDGPNSVPSAPKGARYSNLLPSSRSATQRLIASSFSPTVLTQWPRAQKVLSLPTTLPHSGWRSRSTMADLPFTYPITSDTAILGGILTHTCTWSGQVLPSTTSQPLCSKSLLSSEPTSGRLCWNSTFLLYFGIQTMWYVQSHLVCDKLASFIGFLPFLARFGHRGGFIMGREPFLCHLSPDGWNHPPTTGIACGFLSSNNKKHTTALVVIAAGIILITAGLMIAVPGDYLTTYERLGGSNGYSYIREYVGGDAYNYITGASLVAGHISGTMAMKAVFITVGVLVTCMGLLAFAFIANQPKESAAHFAAAPADTATPSEQLE